MTRQPHEGRVVELFGRSYTWTHRVIGDPPGWSLVADTDEVIAARAELIGAVLDLQARVTA